MKKTLLKKNKNSFFYKLKKTFQSYKTYKKNSYKMNINIKSSNIIKILNKNNKIINKFINKKFYFQI